MGGPAGSSPPAHVRPQSAEGDPASRASERAALIRRLLPSAPLSPRFRRLAALLALASALGLASYAQNVIGRPLPAWMSPFSRIDEELVRIYGRPQSVLLAFGLFVGAGLLFVLATRKGHESEAPGRWPFVNAAALWQDGWGKLSLGLFLGGLALWSYVVARLWSGGYREQYALLFGLSLVGLTAPFVRWDLSAGLRVRFGFHFHWWEPLLVAALAVTFFALNVRDLDGWRYSFIGDEGNFFNLAREIAGGRTWNLFSQAGAYGDYPVASSTYQAMVMKVFGVDYFGWKMASLLVIVATIPAFYVLMRVAFGLRQAVFATLFLSASHYLFSYAHTGYIHVFAVFPVVLAFALFFIGWRYASSFALFAAGAAAGLGFYTFYSARAAIVVLAVFVLTMGFRRWRPSFAGVVALGFSLVALPIFAVNKMDVINAMLNHTPVRAEHPLGRHLLENVPRALFAFNYNPNEGHYLAGSLMDVASAVLAVLGLAYSLSRIRSGSHRFLVIWYAAAVVATGLFATYDRVAFERMHIVLPAMAAFAGIAVDQTLVVLEDALRPERLKPLLTGLAVVVLVPLVFALNIHRFWVDSARASPTHIITVAARAVMEGPCAGNGSSNAIVTEQSQVPSSALDYVFSIYGLTDNKPALLSYEGESAGSLAGFRCVVLVAVDRPPAQSLLQDLLRDDPARSVEEVWDLSRSNRVLVVRHPG